MAMLQLRQPLELRGSKTPSANLNLLGFRFSLILGVIFTGRFARTVTTKARLPKLEVFSCRPTLSYCLRVKTRFTDAEAMSEAHQAMIVGACAAISLFGQALALHSDRVISAAQTAQDKQLSEANKKIRRLENQLRGLRMEAHRKLELSTVSGLHTAVVPLGFLSRCLAPLTLRRGSGPRQRYSTLTPRGSTGNTISRRILQHFDILWIAQRCLLKDILWIAQISL